MFQPWSDGKWEWPDNGAFEVTGNTDALFAVERVVDAVAAGSESSGGHPSLPAGVESPRGGY